MILIDALITLKLSPLDAMDALNQNYQLAHAIFYGDADDEGFEAPHTLQQLNKAYQTLEEAITSGVNRTDCIETAADLNKLLHVLTQKQYGDLFAALGERIIDVVRDEKHLKQTLAGLDNEKLAEATLLLNQGLPLFGVFAKNIGRVKSPSLPSSTLEAIHENSNCGEKPRMVTSPTQAANLNFLARKPSPPPMLKAVNRTASLDLTKQSLSTKGCYAEQPLSLLIDALHKKDLDAIASAYQALIEGQPPRSAETMDSTAIGARISAYSILYFALGKPNALNYALRTAAGIGILYELYANKEHLREHFSSEPEIYDIEEKLTILTSALSQMGMEFKLDLNQALKLHLSRTALKDNALLQQALMDYSLDAIDFHPEYGDSAYQTYS
ncbi:MAG: hypothetical protein K0U24_09015 [Gammaproteobacteria bacterium]|nr:hypothetical protein [Gammaproteobacteria bacterium]MCH9764342.1 hypothetical protein [Gammaproteobacteria bacterium]